MTKKKSESDDGNRSKNHSLEEEPSFNSVLEPEAGGPEKNARGISRASAVLLALMATLAGGAIGWGGPAFFGKTAQKTAAIQSGLDGTKAELSQAAKDREALEARLDQLQSDTRTTGSAARNVNQTLAALQADIDELKAKPEPVDSSAAIAELNERIAAVSAFSGDEESSVNALELVKRLEALEQDSGPNEDLAPRLEALEAKIANLTGPATEPVFPKPDTEPIEVPAVDTAQDREEALRVLVDSFPRTKMLEAVKAQEIIANKKPSWLQRLLSRHVKVRDDDKALPATVIDDAEAALKDGNISEAVRLINTLNPPVKAVAADWISAAKKTAKQIEKDL